MLKLELATVLVTVTLGWQGYQAVKPPAVTREGRLQQVVEQAADADELKQDRRRNVLRDGLNAERRRRLVPSQQRPSLPARVARGIGRLMRRIPLRP